MRRPPPDNNDSRAFELVYDPRMFVIGARSIWFSQRELRMLLKHVEGRNRHLSSKITEFILSIDAAEKSPTDFSTRVPRTRRIRVVV